MSKRLTNDLSASCFGLSAINEFVEYDLFGPASDAVYPSDPHKLIGSHERLVHTLPAGHLPGAQFHPPNTNAVDLRKVGINLFGIPVMAVLTGTMVFKRPEVRISLLGSRKPPIL